MSVRPLLIVPLVALLALGGCRMRDDAPASQPSEETESSPGSMAPAASQSQLDADNAKIAELQQSLDLAQKKLAAGGDTIGSSISGEDIPGLERTASGGVALPEDFAFAKGSAELNSDGEKTISKLAEHLNQGDNAGKHVVVKGFTDDTPVSRHTTKEKYVDNWGLSAARAAAVVRALEKAGVTSERLTGAFRGQLDPRASGATTEDKARNRRVEINLSN